MTARFPLALAVALLAAACAPAPADAPRAEADPETRIIEHLRDTVEPGQAVDVTRLASDVFTSPVEQAALDRLYNAFLKIPMFLVQFQTSTERLPTLEEISQQFGFTAPAAAEVLLHVMESDPRIPAFFERDPSTGEITRIEVEAIREHPQFGQQIERTLAGWEGREIPDFAMERLEGGQVARADLAGRPFLLYVWFTDCPPCVATSPLLVDLYAAYADTGFEIVAANADRLLDLPYDDDVRSGYIEELNIRFPTTHLSSEVHDALGGVAVFPTMFFVNAEGIVVRHFMNFREQAVLEEAVEATL